MKVSDFDFDLPEDRIALHPARPRDAARLLRIPAAGAVSDRVVRDLPDLLRPGDALVLNDTRVLPAALAGLRHRAGTPGASVAFNLDRRLGPDRWRAFARPAKRLRPGDRVGFGAPGAGEVCELGVLNATVEAEPAGGAVDLRFDLAGPDLDFRIQAVGSMPLPPYIASRRPVDEGDRADYQTVFARQDGAVAAPTAGLHFTEALFASLEAREISRHFVTLHVGAGTFLPMRGERIEAHEIHAEWGSVTEATAAALNGVRAAGGRIVCVGTTSLRILETAAGEQGAFAPFTGETDLFIRPGHLFRSADLLMTNFHLPKSSLFVLVAAFAGLERMRAAYTHAVAAGYRFYSYGDACLIECTSHA